LTFLRFCIDLGVTPLPCSSHTNLKFIAWLKLHKKLGPEAIRGYLAAVKHLHSINGLEFGGEGDPRVKLARKAANKRAAPRDPRLPITLSILVRLVTLAATQDDYQSRLFIAAATLGYFGWLRASELCGGDGVGGPRGLRWKNLTVKGNTLVLLIERGKTDIYHKGTEVGILPAAGVACPVRSLIRYLAVRPGDPQDEDFLLVQENGTRMTIAWFRTTLKNRCAAAGLGAGFNAHSLRIGAAMDAAQTGMPSYLIKLRGRWRSDAYLTYIRPTCGQIAEAAGKSGSLSSQEPDSPHPHLSNKRR
jgi:hypothetical protein